MADQSPATSPFHDPLLNALAKMSKEVATPSVASTNTSPTSDQSAIFYFMFNYFGTNYNADYYAYSYKGYYALAQLNDIEASSRGLTSIRYTYATSPITTYYRQWKDITNVTGAARLTMYDHSTGLSIAASRRSPIYRVCVKPK